VSIKIIAILVEYIVKFVSVRDINQGRTAIEPWQRPQFLFLRLMGGMKEETQRGFHQFGHGFILTSSFAAKTRHDRVINVERGLHMESHIE